MKKQTDNTSNHIKNNNNNINSMNTISNFNLPIITINKSCIINNNNNNNINNYNNCINISNYHNNNNNISNLKNLNNSKNPISTNRLSANYISNNNNNKNKKSNLINSNNNSNNSSISKEPKKQNKIKIISTSNSKNNSKSNSNISTKNNSKATSKVNSNKSVFNIVSKYEIIYKSYISLSSLQIKSNIKVLFEVLYDSLIEKTTKTTTNSNTTKDLPNINIGIKETNTNKKITTHSSKLDKEKSYFQSSKEMDRKTLINYAYSLYKLFELEYSSLIMAMIYLDRIEAKITITTQNIKRMITVAFMVSNKYNEDTTFSDVDFADLLNMNPKDLFIMEASFLSLMNYELFVDFSLFEEYYCCNNNIDL